MQFSSIAAYIALAAQLALAMPSPQTADDLASINTSRNNPDAPPPPPRLPAADSTEIRTPDTQPNGLYTCDQPNWQGNCAWRRIPWLTCKTDPSLRSALSLGSDTGNHCTFFATDDCSGQTVMHSQFPGVADMTKMTGMAQYYYHFKSVKCYSKDVFDLFVGGKSVYNVVDPVH